MKRNRDQHFIKILRTDVPSLFLIWLKGVWSSLRRLAMRLLRPKRGRRNYTGASFERASNSPLVGVEQFRHAESLTVRDLMAKVQWRVPKSSAKTSTATSISSIREEINWE